MKKIEFTKEEKAAITGRIQRYFSQELDQTIGTLPAEFLLEFFSGEIGNYYYNRGLKDAQAALLARLEDVSEDIYLLERPTDLKR